MISVIGWRMHGGIISGKKSVRVPAAAFLLRCTI